MHSHVHNTYFLTSKLGIEYLRCLPCLLPDSTKGVMENQTAAEEEVDPVEEKLREHIEREKKLWALKQQISVYHYTECFHPFSQDQPTID